MSVCRIRTLVFAVFLLVLLGAHIALAAERVTVAIDETYSPMSFVAPNGKPEGILVELWRLWSEQTGIEVEFVHGSWEHTWRWSSRGRRISTPVSSKTMSARSGFPFPMRSTRSRVRIFTGQTPGCLT